ncbi:hypothetical protein PsorP6_019303 [Peronosclerospora sorghi]|nr:hypothetical protein PsorP6_019303 [Peronosclerospora sorghi]
METPIKSGTTRRCYEFAPNLSQAVAANTETTETVGTSLFVTCLEMVNITSDESYVRALVTVDQVVVTTHASVPWHHSPNVVNSRTNANWNFEWNGHKVKATLQWESPSVPRKG